MDLDKIKAKDEVQTRATNELEKVTPQVKAASLQGESVKQQQGNAAGAEAVAADSDEFEWTVLNSEADEEVSKQVCLI